MVNQFEKSDEVYNSICKAIQDQINKIFNLTIPMSPEQIQETINCIGRLNVQLEVYANRHKKK